MMRAGEVRVVLKKPSGLCNGSGGYEEIPEPLDPSTGTTQALRRRDQKTLLPTVYDLLASRVLVEAPYSHHVVGPSS